MSAFKTFIRSDLPEKLDCRALALQDLRSEEREFPDFDTVEQLREWLLERDDVLRIENDAGLEAVWADFRSNEFQKYLGRVL